MLGVSERRLGDAGPMHTFCFLRRHSVQEVKVLWRDRELEPEASIVLLVADGMLQMSEMSNWLFSRLPPTRMQGRRLLTAFHMAYRSCKWDMELINGGRAGE